MKHAVTWESSNTIISCTHSSKLRMKLPQLSWNVFHRMHYSKTWMNLRWKIWIYIWFAKNNEHSISRRRRMPLWCMHYKFVETQNRMIPSCGFKSVIRKYIWMQTQTHTLKTKMGARACTRSGIRIEGRSIFVQAQIRPQNACTHTKCIRYSHCVIIDAHLNNSSGNSLLLSFLRNFLIADVDDAAAAQCF